MEQPEFIKYTEGLGQEAKELPPNWRCFTEAEVERIVSLAVLDALNGRGRNEYGYNNARNP